MGSLRDGGVFGAVGTLVAFVGDVVLNSGELVASVAAWFVTNTDLLLPMFTTLRGYIAPEVAWIPADLLDKAILTFAFLMVLILAYRLVNRTTGRIN